MACGCNKKKTAGRRTTVRPATGRGVTPALTQAQLKATQGNPAAQAAGLNSEKRKMQALKRDAINKAFNK